MNFEYQKKNIRDVVYNIVIFLLVIVIMFLACEFCARFSKVAGLALKKTYNVAQQKMRAYDELLGWKNKPYIDFKGNYFGKEVDMRTNSMGFRGRGEYAHEEKGARCRIIALGDSMTFGGEGIRDDETWPFYLERAVRRTAGNAEVINMSCIAYGIDQEYLWFKRDGLRLNPCVLVLGLSDLSFSRATLSRWIQGENKPKFIFRGNRLQLTNVPVPLSDNKIAARISRKDALDILFRWEGSYVWSFIKNRLYKINSAIGANLPEVSESYRLGKAILDEMEEDCLRENIKMIVVFLPKPEWGDNTPPIYHAILKLGKDKRMVMEDFTEYFRKTGKWGDFFMKDGHFSPEANRIIAERISSIIESDQFLKECCANDKK
jgi:hypothetical protein